jgi:hypothetical protein
MEKLFYEAKPMIFLAIAFYALANAKQSTIMSVSGWILMAAVLAIFYGRYHHRHSTHRPRR